MHFLTEDDVRARCAQPGSTLALAPGERLTPAASEYATSLRITVTTGTAGAGPQNADPGPRTPATPPAAPAVPTVSGAMTWLDAATQVPKTSGRIVFRGKLDSLLAAVVLAQTQFDPKDRLPGLLKTCLSEIKNWVLQILAAELSGEAPAVSGMAGMDMDSLHAVSRDPALYLGMEHCMADETQGGDVALVNWLRALTRETEISALANLPAGSPICPSLNRLSSALYVLMLLTMAARSGKDLSQMKAR